MSDETTGKRRVKACRLIRAAFEKIGWDSAWQSVQATIGEQEGGGECDQTLIEQVRKRRDYSKGDAKDPLSRVTARQMIALQKLVDDVGGWEVLLAVAEEMVGMPE